jgi:hypothetical protein
MLEIHGHVGEWARCGAADGVRGVFSLAHFGHHHDCYLTLGRHAGDSVISERI